MTDVDYEYRNLPIPGGGYVTGFHYDAKDKGTLYLRTDIGGIYRFDGKSWIPLNDDVNMDDIRATFPIAVTTDEDRPGSLYVISGIWDDKYMKKHPGKLSVSDDYGKTFKHYELPFRAHGNLNGRGTGGKLIVDRTFSSRLIYASQADGLWKSADSGATWEKLGAMPEEYLTFVAETLDNRALIVGTAGVTTTRSPSLRGPALYISYDNGETFEQMPQPADGETEGVKRAGFVAQRVAVSDKYVFVTMSVMGRDAFVDELGYSCDGGSVINGRLLRYEIDTSSKTVSMTDITPEGIEGGLSGVAVSVSKPGLLCVSTISEPTGDAIYRSEDNGDSWKLILKGLETGEMRFRTSYMKPQYNGGSNIIHWLTDLAIDPFDENVLWFNTGTGVFETTNLTDDVVVFSDRCDGLEETVHLNLYSPPYGDVLLVDILGDLGGFAFRTLDTTPDNSFDDHEGNRYITCINADYSDVETDTCVITARGNWRGKTVGGLIKTTDGFLTFDRLANPFGLSEKLDESLHMIETPNVNPGWVALSVDCENIVWCVAEKGGVTLPIDMVVVSHDGGESFHRAKIYDVEKKEIVLRNGEYRGLKVFSDRVVPELFYGFDNHGHVFISTDCGNSFYEREESLPDFDISNIDCADKSCVRGECGRIGVFYISLSEHGLMKLHYDPGTDKLRIKKLSWGSDVIYNIGLGLGREDGDYFTEPKAIYFNGKLGGKYGFYRSLDDMATYERINNDSQMFGDINCIEGDSTVFGRFFIGSGSRGVLYGIPV